MRQEGKDLKTSWPKLAAKKWWNVKSGTDDFRSDCEIKETGGLHRRRKSPSNDGSNVIVPVELSEDFSMETSDQIGRPMLNQLEQPTTSNPNLRMFVGTWNVGGNSPDGGSNLGDWLETNEPKADIYVLGFQEIVPLNAGNVLGPEDSEPSSKWISLTRKALNEKSTEEHSNNCQNRFVLAARKQMVGIFLCVWIREDLYQDITNLKVSCVGRGLLSYLGNKGSISISMTLCKTKFCFVCTHLASGERDRDATRRNSDIAEILKRTKFSHPQRIPGKPVDSYSILDHDNIIWLGDLNYRLSSIPTDTFEQLEKIHWQDFLGNDELRIEQMAGRIFEDWKEGKINFAPTYKYLVNSNCYAVKTSKQKRRSPAWCDRILWRGKGLYQIEYNRGESRFSDHRPVYSIFSVDLNLKRDLNTLSRKTEL